MSAFDIIRWVLVGYLAVWIVASVFYAVTRHRTKSAKTGYSERP